MIEKQQTLNQIKRFFKARAMESIELVLELAANQCLKKKYDLNCSGIA